MAKLDKKIYYNPQPINVDVEIRKMQDSITQIDWMEACYGRAWKQFENDPKGGKGQIVPMTYQGKKEYFNCLPNDTFQSFAFFIVNDSIEPLQYDAFHKGIYEYNVDLIVWYNQKKTHPSIDYPLCENLCQDVKKALRGNSRVTIKEIFFEPDKVYRNFTLDSNKEKQAMFPFGCFRINLDVTAFEIDEFGGC